MKTPIFEDGKHEYDFEQKDNNYALYYSDNGEWTHQGEIAFEIKDTGNEVKFKSRKPKQLDYDEISQLHILLKFYFADTKIEKAHLELL